MFKRIKYNNQPMDGIIQHIQNQTHFEDIIEHHFASITVPTTRTDPSAPSFDRKVLFGIDNTDYRKYWSTENYQEKHIFFAFKFPILLEGIGITNNYCDWFSKYTLNYSTDMIQWHVTTMSTTWIVKGDSLKTYYFSLSQSIPFKFLNITPSTESLNERINFAFYGIEFFGTLLPPFQATCLNYPLFFKKLKFTLIFFFSFN